MTLNIKNPEAHRLALAISQATGESMTQVVIDALREHYERVQKNQSKAGYEELRGIAQRVADCVQAPYSEHAEVLYDDLGLPR